MSSVFIVACTPSSSSSSSDRPRKAEHLHESKKKKKGGVVYEGEEEEEGDRPVLFHKAQAFSEKGSFFLSSLFARFSPVISRRAPNPKPVAFSSSPASSSFFPSSLSSLTKRCERVTHLLLKIDFSFLLSFFFRKLERLLERISLGFSGRSAEVELEFALWKVSQSAVHLSVDTHRSLLP